MMNRQLSPEALAHFAALDAEQAAYEQQLPKIREEGEAALRRLFDIAHGHSGQCRHVAAFLLGCYNGARFPFDLTDFRFLDRAIFEDCLVVLRMDSHPQQEVHEFFPDGGRAFEKLADAWRIRDRSRTADSPR